MYQNGQTWGNIVFPSSNDIETSTVVHVHYPEESLFSLLLLTETVHAASNRVFIADRLEVKLQPTKLHLFGLLASLSSLNVADDYCNEFSFFFENFETFLFDHDMPPTVGARTRQTKFVLFGEGRQPWTSQHPF